MRLTISRFHEDAPRIKENMLDRFLDAFTSAIAAYGSHQGKRVNSL